MKTLYGSVNDKIVVETAQATYSGILKSCDGCMNLAIETDSGMVFVAGSVIKLFILSPEQAFAPHLI